MSSPQETNGRISVSEDKLNAALSGLELRIVDRITDALEVKADQSEVDGIRQRMHTAEGTLAALAYLAPAHADVETRTRRLERFRYSVPSAAAIACVAAVIAVFHPFA